MDIKLKRLTVIFIVFLILLSFTNHIFSANVKAKLVNGSNERIGILNRLARFFGELATGIIIILRLFVIAVASDPPIIEIGYNETVNIEVGMWNINTNDGFEVWPKGPTESIYKDRYLNFEVVEYPGGSNAKGSWFVTFKPHSLKVYKGIELKTNVTITLTAPPSSSDPIQSGILKIRILDTGVYGNMYLPPKDAWNNKFPLRFFWFMSAAFTMGYGKYSGSTDVMAEDVNILVKIKPYHALKFESVPLVRLNPDQITSIPIRLQNLGNYNDSFIFKLVDEDSDIKLSAPYSITLAPGEIKNTYLGVSVPQDVFDYGTIRQLTIEAYSIDDLNTSIAKRVIYIETRGIYISEMMGGSFVFLIIIIALGAALMIHRRRLFLYKYCIKPDKPWEIPEEKKYLEKLKESNDKKYNEISKMMQDEYESSLLWYKDYCKSIVKPKPVKKTTEKPKPVIKTTKKVKTKKPIFKFKWEKRVKKKEKKEQDFKKIEEKKEKQRIEQIEQDKKMKEKREQQRIEQIEQDKKMKEKRLQEDKEKRIQQIKEKERQIKLKKIEKEKRRKQQVLSRVRREQKIKKRKFI